MPSGVAVGDLRRQLQRQARLAGAARSGERQEPVLREQVCDVLQLALATHERRQLDGQVVGARVERAQGREVGRAGPR